MEDFFSDCDEPITVERALTYLVIWHYKGIAYKVPTNGLTVSFARPEQRQAKTKITLEV